MANLIKNGDFSQQGNEWTATNPNNVLYVTGHCIIAAPILTSQEVLTGSGAGGQFMLSARMKTIPGSAARITVQPFPTGEPVSLISVAIQTGPYYPKIRKSRSQRSSSQSRCSL